MKYLFLILTLIISQFAAAKDVEDMTQNEMIEFSNSWQVIDKNNKGALYIKPATIQEDEAGHKVFWARFTQYGVGTTDILYVMDCKHGKIGGSGIVKYDKNMKEIKSNQLPTEYAPLQYPPPDSIQHNFLQGLCT